jgi:hypothetical protein
MDCMILFAHCQNQQESLGKHPMFAVTNRLFTKSVTKYWYALVRSGRASNEGRVR